MKKKISLIFDLDGTLYDRTYPFRDALRDVVQAEIPDYPRELHVTYEKHSQEMFFAHERGEVSLEESRALRIMNTMKEYEIPFDREMAARFQERYQYYQYHLTLSDEWKEVLTQLKEMGFCLAVLTNGPVKHQMEKLRSLGMERWIPEKNYMISEAIGCVKPDVRIFRYVEEKLGLVPEDTIMIGDSYESDIEGAARAGWKTIWYNTDGLALPGDIVPDHTVLNVRALLDVLK